MAISYIFTAKRREYVAQTVGAHLYDSLSLASDRSLPVRGNCRASWLFHSDRSSATSPTGAHRATTAEKLRGTKGLGPNTGALAPRARPKAELGVGCGWESPPPAVRVREYHPRKIFENSDAKSYILVTTCCKISCF